MFYMQERLGAWQTSGDETSGNVSFKLFFPSGFDPQIQSVRVGGSFQHHLGTPDWDFDAGPPLQRNIRQEGDFWTFSTTHPLPAGFYEYKYAVTFTDGTTRIVSDPCTRYGGTSHQNAGFVIGGSRPEDNIVQPLAQRKPLRELVVYEMHIDDFTDEYRGVRAPLDAVTDKLDYLAALGFNAILFMPWTAWKHRDFDWGYEPFQYFAVEYRYANDLNHPEEKISWLKKMISACHARGIHVILDGVFNHVSPDFPYRHLYRDPAQCPYAGDFGGTFPGLQDLNFNNACTQEFIRDVCLYWIEVFSIDGIRFDNTVNYHREDDLNGLPQLLQDIRAFLDARQETNFSLTLEHLQMDAATVTNTTQATSYWDNALYQHCFDGLWHGRIEPGLLNALNNDRHVLSDQKAATLYLSNHDHSHVTWQAGARDNQGAMYWYRTQPWAIALLTAPGVPMIQHGQEFGEDHWIPEHDEGTGRRVVPRPLRWKLADDPIGRALRQLYRRLIQLRHQYPALRSRNMYPAIWDEWQTQFNPEGFGVDTARQLAIFHRWSEEPSGFQRFYIVLNFSDNAHPVSLRLPVEGPWVDLLSGLDGSWSAMAVGGLLQYEVQPYWGNIFFRED